MMTEEICKAIDELILEDERIVFWHLINKICKRVDESKADSESSSSLLDNDEASFHDPEDP